MTNTYITADLHLGDPRFSFFPRPFKTTDEMADTLVKNFNEIVNPEDELIIVGDAVYQKAPEALPQLARFNGKKTLIRGNHDRVFSDEQLAPFFEKIIPEGYGMELDIPGIAETFWLTHYPSQARSKQWGLQQKDYFNLVGHIHSAWRCQLNMINVGIDCWCYKPVSLPQIAEFYTVVTTLYDNDIWAAYLPSNMQYRGLRGKQDSYFKN